MYTTYYNDKDDGDRVVAGFSVIGVPTHPAVKNPGGGHLVHWRVHIRWAGKGPNGFAAGSVVLDTMKVDAKDPIVLIERVSSPAIAIYNIALILTQLSGPKAGARWYLIRHLCTGIST